MPSEDDPVHLFEPVTHHSDRCFFRKYMLHKKSYPFIGGGVGGEVDGQGNDVHPELLGQFGGYFGKGFGSAGDKDEVEAAVGEGGWAVFFFNVCHRRRDEVSATCDRGPGGGR